MIISNLLIKTETGNLEQSTEEVQTLLNDEWDETPDESPLYLNWYMAKD